MFMYIDISLCVYILYIYVLLCVYVYVCVLLCVFKVFIGIKKQPVVVPDFASSLVSQLQDVIVIN